MKLPLPRLQWSILLSVLFLIIFTRAPFMLMYPPLQVEDGAYVFAHFYQKIEIGEIFRAKSGYIPLISNLIGYLSVRLPTRLIPYGLSWLPLLITLLAYSLFFSKRYRCLLESDLSRAVVCLLFALAPLSQFHLLIHTDYSIWNTLVVLILLSSLRLPSRGGWTIPLWLAINLFIWSHPLSIIILPFQVLFLVRDKPRRTLYTLTIINLIAHQLLGVRSTHIFADLDLLGVVLAVFKAMLGTLVIASKIAFRSAFGAPLLGWAAKEMWFLIAYWTVFLSCITGIVFWKRPQYRLLILSATYLILSVTFLSVLSRGYQIAGDIANGPRYAYIQSLAFVALFVSLADALIHSRISFTQIITPERPSGSGETDVSSASATRHWWATGIFALLILHYYLLNTQYGHYLFFNKQSHSPYVAAHPDNGMIVYRFFQDLATAEVENKGRTGIYLVAKKINDWPIEIDTRIPK